MPGGFCVELTEHELIVLNHALDELGDKDELERLLPHAADRQILHDLVCLLERQNPVIFASDYAERLEAARRQVLPG
jgi:hypothetical protein